MFVNATYYVPKIFPGALPDFGLKTIIYSALAMLVVVGASYIIIYKFGSWSVAAVARKFGSTALSKESCLALCMMSLAQMVYFMGLIILASIVLAMASLGVDVTALLLFLSKMLQPLIIIWSSYIFITLYMKVINFRALGSYFTACLGLFIPIVILICLFAVPVILAMNSLNPKIPNPSASTQYQQSAESIEKNIDEQLRAIQKMNVESGTSAILERNKQRAQELDRRSQAIQAEIRALDEDDSEAETSSSDLYND